MTKEDAIVATAATIVVTVVAVGAVKIANKWLQKNEAKHLAEAIENPK